VRLQLPPAPPAFRVPAHRRQVFWSAGTCHRFCRFGDLSPKQGRVERPARAVCLPAFDGDKSPAESADKSAHSKVAAASRRCEDCGSTRSSKLGNRNPPPLPGRITAVQRPLKTPVVVRLHPRQPFSDARSLTRVRRNATPPFGGASVLASRPCATVRHCATRLCHFESPVTPASTLRLPRNPCFQAVAFTPIAGTHPDSKGVKWQSATGGLDENETPCVLRRWERGE